MRMTNLMLMAALLLGSQVAVAGELQPTPSDVRNVYVQYGHGMLPGLLVNGRESGWSVPLPYAADDACTARLHDISPAPMARLDRAEKMAPHQGRLTLARARYAGSHTYRISFQCASSKVADVLVHLGDSELASR